MSNNQITEKIADERAESTREKERLLPKQKSHKKYDGTPGWILDTDEQLSLCEKILSSYQMFVWFISRGRIPRILNNRFSNDSPENVHLHDVSTNASKYDLEDDDIHFGSYPYVDSFLNGVYFVTNKLYPALIAALLFYDGYAYNNFPQSRIDNSFWRIFLGSSDNNNVLSNNLLCELAEKGFPVWAGTIALILTPLLWGAGNVLKHSYYNKMYKLLKKSELNAVLENPPHLSLVSTFDPLWCALHNVKYAILKDAHLNPVQREELFNKIIDLANAYPKYKAFIFEIIADICDFNDVISHNINGHTTLMAEAQNNNVNTKIDSINKLYAKYKLWSLGLNESRSNHLLFALFPGLLFIFTGYAKYMIGRMMKRDISGCTSHSIPTPAPTTVIPTSTPAPTLTQPVTTTPVPTNSSTPTPTPISTNTTTPTPNPTSTNTTSPTPAPTTTTPQPTTTTPNNPCENAEDVYEFMPEFSENICSMCGNLPVYINDINSVQGCVSGLLAQPQTPEYILSSLNQLIPFANNSNLNTIDLSQQTDWPNWNTTIFGQILDIFTRLTKQLDNFDVSLSAPNTNFIDNGNLQKIAEFSHSVIINKINFKNLGAGQALTNSFLNNSHISNCTYFDFSANNITDPQYLTICQNLPPSLTTFKIANNNITDSGFAQAAQYIANSAIEYLDISYTAISNEISQSITTILNKGILKFLKFIGNDLTGVDLAPFWLATTQNSSLSGIDFSGAQLIDNQIASLAPYANQTSIRNFIMRDNLFGNSGISIFISSMRNTSASLIDFSYSLLNDVGVAYIGQNLPYIPIKTLILDGIQITNIGLQQLANGLVDSVVNSLSLQSNFLDDNSISILNNWTQTPDKLINMIDVSTNDISDIGGVILANMIINSTITEIKLNNNKQLTSVTGTVFANNFPNSNLKIFEANGCNFGPETAIAISNVIDDCDIEFIDLGNNPLGNGTTSLALKFITSTPEPNDLSNPIMGNVEASALANAKPASKLCRIILNNVDMDVEGARTICRVMFKANITANNFNIMNNSVDSGEVDLINCRFNQQNDSFNLALRSPISSGNYLTPGLANNNVSGGQAAMIGLSSVIIIVPAVILTVLAIYWMYRTISPSATKLSAKIFGFFKYSEEKDKHSRIDEIDNNENMSKRLKQK